MSQVLEVSEGIPRDGRIFQPAPVNEDVRKPRYVTFLGSLIDQSIASSRPWTKGGGMEMDNPCLRYVKKFLRKGRITPVLMDTHDYLPYDFVKKTTDVDPLGAGYEPQRIPQGYVPPAQPPASGQFVHGFGQLAVGGPSPYGNLVARRAYPGEQIDRILTGAENITDTNMRRGVVELKTLMGHDYRPQDLGNGLYVDPEIWQIQRTILPDYPAFRDRDGNPTVLLNEIERVLQDATVHTQLRAITDEMLESLYQFRDYASTSVRNVHTMRTALEKNGYAWRYTSVDLVLLEQLGMERQDREASARAEQSGGISKSDLIEILQAFQTSNREERQELISMLNKPQEPEQNVSRETASHLCDCGKEFPTPQGLALHKTRHCELNKKEAEESSAESV